MKEIPLTQGKVAIIDDEDFDYLNQWKWHYEHTGYAYRSLSNGGKTIMHRLITKVTDGMEIDHINGNGLDNRKENLRICTHAENGRNTKLRKDNTLGYKGIKICGNKWSAQIKIGHQYIHLGTFNSINDAVHAYDNAAIKYFGEFANPNLR